MNIQTKIQQSLQSPLPDRPFLTQQAGCLWSWPYGRTGVQVVAVEQRCDQGGGNLKHLQLLSALIGPADLQPGATHLWPEHWPEKTLKQASKTAARFRKREGETKRQTERHQKCRSKQKVQKARIRKGSEREREGLLNVFIQCFTSCFSCWVSCRVNPLTWKPGCSTESPRRTTTGQLH